MFRNMATILLKSTTDLLTIDIDGGSIIWFTDNIMIDSTDHETCKQHV